MPTFRYEIQLGRKSGAVICGVDEAGRRPPGDASVEAIDRFNILRATPS
jgi:hypothetical protein